MAEMNCPMCGRLNPSDEETCHFCGSRLKPLVPLAPENSLPVNGEEQGDTPQSADLTDWLAGLDKVASEADEQPSDWLASLRDGSLPAELPADEPLLEAEPLAGDSADTDWLARLDEGRAEPALPQVAAASVDDFPAQVEEPAPPQSTEAPRESTGEPADERQALSEVGTAGNEPENLPDWLEQLKDKAISPETRPGSEAGLSAGTDMPEWLSNFEPGAGTPPPAPAEALPDWMANLGARTTPDLTPPDSVFSAEFPGPEAISKKEPDWLSQFQADMRAAEDHETKQEQFESGLPAPGLDKSNEPLPDWLVGVKSDTPASDGTPALISSESPASANSADQAFPMETPDWLSQLNPEVGEEKPAPPKAAPGGSENLEVSELPYWVQAMRPMESVVAASSAGDQEEPPLVEQSGPLAGLQGVLPTGPGLGAMRKPPAYSSILQVSDGQQRYASALEHLVASETQSQEVKTDRLGSNRLWRWVITLLMLLAVGIPLMMKSPLSPPAAAQLPREILNAFTTMDQLSAAPDGLTPQVLVVFDYDPAFSGELEAAAAPLIDYLLLNKAPRLALISTNPTGPALAERFFSDMNASPLIARHAYQAGQNYINLGYLAGGASAVQYFALAPSQAAPARVDGQSAWQSTLLQGIQDLGDFAAILVLTDNADSGRGWIEQTRSALDADTPLNPADDTPLLMVISAQAEPMIAPYFDSGQIKGMLSGLAGGVLSERNYVVDSTGLAGGYWSSFGTGIFTAMLLIVVGGLWSAVNAWRTRRSDPGEGN